jgi:hypothetical protein
MVFGQEIPFRYYFCGNCKCDKFCMEFNFCVLEASVEIRFQNCVDAPDQQKEPQRMANTYYKGNNYNAGSRIRSYMCRFWNNI